MFCSCALAAGLSEAGALGKGDFDCGENEPLLHWFHKVARHPDAAGTLDELPVGESRQQHDAAGKVLIYDELCGAESVKDGHAHIEQHNVRVCGAAELDGVKAVAGLAYDRKAKLRQHLREVEPCDGLVIHNDDRAHFFTSAKSVNPA
ncbi:hypothetical protein SDC9_72296 [bioreactor metagenome]|uniref:Uncharacterized protein n=1 Tax=bioreactor metagenome TaxID=1076179 RepID=A0A644YB67_9ZZZZ